MGPGSDLVEAPFGPAELQPDPKEASFGGMFGPQGVALGLLYRVSIRVPLKGSTRV